MRDVSVIGIGQVPVGDLWEKPIYFLAVDAMLAALQDAHVEQIDSVYIGNMLSGTLAGQDLLAGLTADQVGLTGVEAVKIEAACSSGGAAFREGYLAVASGLVNFALICGVEKMLDHPGKEITEGLVSASDADWESALGDTFVAINARLMQRYMHEYGIRHEEFAPFPINSHHNAVNNPNAMLRYELSREQFNKARMIADPINLLDCSPVCDGAAAAILCPAEIARQFSLFPIKVRASAIATDSLALHDRHQLLELEAVALSARKAFEQAQLTPRDIDFFEVHDAFSITAVASLEASGFAEPGKGVRLGLDGEIGLQGKLPICTMGGLKARGHPVGATGMYQIVEAMMQLRGLAGKNQVKDAAIGMTQNIGGSGSNVVTHIFERE
ncbi:MAG TPA: thiolase domain-containing protein [Anaerolineae bacterium]|nr:thiolase domain-containing protein [Anaerolineae bacterium]